MNKLIVNISRMFQVRTVVIGSGITHNDELLQNYVKTIPPRRRLVEVTRHIALAESLRGKRVFQVLLHRQLFRLSPSAGFIVCSLVDFHDVFPLAIIFTWGNWLCTSYTTFKVDQYFENINSMRAEIYADSIDKKIQ